ncbi:hypothetical protein FE257_000609 [Aspergillus nanangensis]|uniref:Uncharacterized protein n=1 Tax=Aspergillus nanangensis TaxID=2582783 RepID=A0AAD4CF02_ASPNN|nr:hypothetical protein FE257_000609 [Aspergillus nanangensis]
MKLSKALSIISASAALYIPRTYCTPANPLTRADLRVVISAQECDPNQMDPLSNGSGVWTISSQDQLESISNSCSTMVGDINIASNYTGSFILPRVSNITGVISDIGLENNLTSIELLDAAFLGGFDLTDHNYLSISGPNVTEVGRIDIANGLSVSVSLPRLGTVAEISLSGGFSNLDFSGLKNITSKLEMCSDASCNPESGEALNASFPVLETARSMKIIGTITTVYMPNLRAAYVDSLAVDGAILEGLSIYNAGGPIAMNFPNLSLVEGKLELQGELSEFSVPELKNTSAAIMMASSSSLSIDLNSLEAASTIDLSGRISSAQFPSLQYVNSIQIHSDIYLDCEGYKDAKGRAFDPDDHHEGDNVGVFSCSAPPAPGNDENDKPSIPGIIAGSVIGGTAVILSIVAGLLFRVIWKKRKKSPVERGSLELRNRVHGRPQTPPPPYSPPEYTP